MVQYSSLAISFALAPAYKSISLRGQDRITAFNAAAVLESRLRELTADLTARPDQWYI